MPYHDDDRTPMQPEGSFSKAFKISLGVGLGIFFSLVLLPMACQVACVTALVGGMVAAVKSIPMPTPPPMRFAAAPTPAKLATAAASQRATPQPTVRLASPTSRSPLSVTADQARDMLEPAAFTYLLSQKWKVARVEATTITVRIIDGDLGYDVPQPPDLHFDTGPILYRNEQGIRQVIRADGRVFQIDRKQSATFLENSASGDSPQTSTSRMRAAAYDYLTRDRGWRLAWASAIFMRSIERKQVPHCYLTIEGRTRVRVISQGQWNSAPQLVQEGPCLAQDGGDEVIMPSGKLVRTKLVAEVQGR